MNKKNLKNIIIIVIIILGGIISYLSFLVIQSSLQKSQVSEELHLTKAIVFPVLKDQIPFTNCVLEGVPGIYSSCVLNISKENNQWIVMLNYDDLYDDSVRAKQIKAIISYREKQWIVENILQTYKCQLNRGQQYFSTELCI